MIHIQALENLISNPLFNWIGVEWDGLIWLDDRPKPTKKAWEEEKARLIAYQPKQNCKDEAKKRISACDWSVLTDVKLINYSQFVEYRAILRDYILNPVENPNFPDEPQPIWAI